MEIEHQKANPVFVVGKMRSGTTLMSSMLSAHPAIAIAPDIHYIYGWAQQCRELDLSRPADFERFWKAFSSNKRFGYLGIDVRVLRGRIEANRHFSFRGVYRATLETYAESVRKRRWGEKTPDTADHLETLFNWFPDARVIYMLRDPRAVVSSMRKTPWGAEQGVHVHARSWAEGVGRALASEGDPHVLRVRYESLVRKPVEELNKVCRFLGEEYSPDMVDSRHTLLTSTLKDRTGWEKEHLTAALQPVHEDSRDKWRNELTPLEIDVIEHYCGRVMEQAGYARSGNPLAAGRRARLFLQGSRIRIQQRFRQSDAARSWRRLKRILKGLRTTAERQFGGSS